MRNTRYQRISHAERSLTVGYTGVGAARLPRCYTSLVYIVRLQEKLMAIEVYGGAELSLERAMRIAPPAYAKAYTWFIEHAGEVGPRPFGDHHPDGMPIKLASWRGIHKPTGYQCALSINSSNKEKYAGDKLNYLDDGTWVMQYCAHRKNEGSTKPDATKGNDALLACLKKGLPVGVFVKEKGGSHNLGLAFVERYNSVADMFWLHGPVTPESDFSSLSPEAKRELEHELKEPMLETYDMDKLRELQASGKLEEIDERERVAAMTVRRKQQGKFRRMLFDAYDGTCAISGYAVDPVLQAAHITPYFGRKSQLVTNGLLLRADLHLLFDNDLLAVNPDDMRVAVSRSLEKTGYGSFDGVRLRLPAAKDSWPSEERLAAQFDNFKQCEAMLATTG